MELWQLPGAEATLRGVIARVPGDAQAWGMLGQVLYMEGKNRGREGGLSTRPSALDPEEPDVRNSLATFLLKEGDAAGAEKEIREAIRIRPGSAAARANLAGLLAARGQVEEARYEFKQSILLNPTFADARLNYARLLASHGETPEAQVQAGSSDRRQWKSCRRASVIGLSSRQQRRRRRCAS